MARHAAGSGGSRHPLVAAALAAALIWLIIGITTSSTPTADNTRQDRLESIAGCEALVEQQLRSPSTADYESTARLNAGTWTVTGTVDSQNALGGTVRTNYECTATINGSNVTTRITSLE